MAFVCSGGVMLPYAVLWELRGLQELEKSGASAFGQVIGLLPHRNVQVSCPATL